MRVGLVFRPPPAACTIQSVGRDAAERTAGAARRGPFRSVDMSKRQDKPTIPRWIWPGFFASIISYGLLGLAQMQLERWRLDGFAQYYFVTGLPQSPQLIVSEADKIYNGDKSQGMLGIVRMRDGSNGPMKDSLTLFLRLDQMPAGPSLSTLKTSVAEALRAEVPGIGARKSADLADALVTTGKANAPGPDDGKNLMPSRAWQGLEILQKASQFTAYGLCLICVCYGIPSLIREERGHLWRAKGRCTECGYPMGTQPRCSECGRKDRDDLSPARAP
jgi:hypothetical protein